jgi:hypothetical protein
MTLHWADLFPNETARAPDEPRSFDPAGETGGAASSLPLNVVVRGEEVLILGPDGKDSVLTVEAARKSAQRLLDAAAVARGHLPARALSAL